MMKTISIINLKGGVGKTTSAVTLASIFATAFKKRTLLIDLDSQFNASSYYLPQPDFDDLDELESYIKRIIVDNELTPLTEYSVQDVLKDSDFDVNKAIYKTPYPNLKIMPSFITLVEAEKYMSSLNSAPQQYRLKNQLAKISDQFDYCIIDCSPSQDLLNTNGLVASDEVLVALKPDFWSLNGWLVIYKLIKTVQSYSPTVHFFGTFLTMYRKNVSSHTFLKDQLEKYMDRYLGIEIRHAAAADNVTYTKELLFDSSRYEEGKPQRNGIGEDYLKLAKRLIKEV